MCFIITKTLFVCSFLALVGCEFRHPSCDFDLIDTRIGILQYLPQECQDLYKEEQTEGIEKFRKAKEEALQFKSFYEILKRRTEIQRDEPDEYLEINFGLLKRIYTKENGESISAGCKNQKGFLEYFDCLIAERRELEQKVAAL
ncbi:hypothetical protein ACFFRR_006324 [Megaselia abdita]